MELQEAIDEIAQRSLVVSCLSDSRLPLIRNLLPLEYEVEVMPFAELVGRVLGAMGLPRPPLATASQIRAAIRFACEELPEGLAISASSRHAGTHDALEKTLTELRHFGIGTQELVEWETRSDLVSYGKIRSLSLISQTVDQSLSNLNRETLLARMRRCYDGDQPVGKSMKPVIVLAGDDQQPERCRWLEWLAGRGVHVELWIQRIQGRKDLFAHHATSLPVDSDQHDPHWYASLFADSSFSGSAPAIFIASTGEVLAECEWALRSCAQRLAEGVNPVRIGILARDAQRYNPLLLSAARRMNLPISIRIPVPLLTNGLCAYTIRVLGALAEPNLRRFAKAIQSGYSGLSEKLRHDCRDVIRKITYTGEEAWKALTAWAEEEPERVPLLEILHWRRKAVSEPLDLRRWHSLVLDWLRSPRLVESVQSEEATAPRDQRAVTAMIRPISELAALYDARDGQLMNLSSFSQLCDELWDKETATLPPNQHGIQITSDPECLGSMDTLVVLGMLEGVFPRRRSEDPILTDLERESISNLMPDKPPLATSFDRSRAERDVLARIAATPQHSLWMLYPQTQDDRDNVPAFYLNEIERVVQNRVTRLDYPRSKIAPNVEDCLCEQDRNFALALTSGPIPSKTPVLSTLTARQRVRPNPEGISPEHIVSAFECPFQAAFRYQLHLTPRVKRNPWSRLASIPTQVKLPMIADKQTARAILSSALEEKIRSLAVDLEPWEESLLQQGATRLVDGWIDREFLARETWAREPDSLQSDIPFESAGVTCEFKHGDETIVLKPKANILGTYMSGGHRVLMLSRTSSLMLTSSLQKSKASGHLLLLGLYLQSLYKPPSVGAIEVDAMKGERILYLLNRPDSIPRTNEPTMKTLDFGLQDRSEFFQETKKLRKLALDAVMNGSIETKPGEHCLGCDLGEICRNHLEFGEGIRLIQEDD